MIVLESVEQAEQLTRREREVLALMMFGEISTEELAERLILSGTTVRYHIASIMRKLDVHDRAHLVSFAWQHGAPLEGQWHPYAR